ARVVAHDRRHALEAVRLGAEVEAAAPDGGARARGPGHERGVDHHALVEIRIHVHGSYLMNETKGFAAPERPGCPRVRRQHPENLAARGAAPRWAAGVPEQHACRARTPCAPCEACRRDRSRSWA